MLGNVNFMLNELTVAPSLPSLERYCSWQLE